jgi:hypothetical protein
MGHGYALLNQNPISATYSGAQLVALDLADELPHIEVVAVWPEHTRLTVRAKAFVRACIDHYLPDDEDTPREASADAAANTADDPADDGAPDASPDA